MSPWRYSLVSRWDGGVGAAGGEHRAADQRSGCEAGPVEEGEDGVVLVVETGEVGRAVELVGGADFVDAVQVGELAEAVGRGRVVLARGRPGYPASHHAADRTVGNVREGGRGFVVHLDVAPTPTVRAVVR